MRFGLKISDHDLGVKLRKVTDFLTAGHKVKITIFYRGREMAHKDLGFTLATKVIEGFGDTAVVESAPQLAGKQLSFVIRVSSAGKATHTLVKEKIIESVPEPVIESGEQDAKAKDAQRNEGPDSSNEER